MDIKLHAIQIRLDGNILVRPVHAGTAVARQQEPVEAIRILRNLGEVLAVRASAHDVRCDTGVRVHVLDSLLNELPCVGVVVRDGRGLKAIFQFDLNRLA